MKDLAAQEIKDIKKQNPEIVVLTHIQNALQKLLHASDFTGSTSGMSKYVKEKSTKKSYVSY